MPQPELSVTTLLPEASITPTMVLRTCFGLLFVAGLAVADSDHPLDILFLIDVSENMSRPADFVIAGARLATFEFRPGDRVAVVSYSSKAKTQTGFTGEAQEIEKAFGKSNGALVRLSRKAHLYDALFSSIEQFPSTPDLNRKRVIAVITNDVDHASACEPADIIREARARGVAVWVFLIASPYASRIQQKNGHPGVPYPDVDFAAQQLEPIAKGTGGKVSIKRPDGYVLRQAIADCRGEP